jgi:hypothetical protein
MKIFISALALSFSFTCLAFDKSQIDSTLQQMKSTGMFSPEQIEAARRQLAGMSDQEVNKLIEDGKAKAQDPDVRNKASVIIDSYKANRQK